MVKLKEILLEALKCFIISSIVSGVLLLVSALISLIVTSGNIIKILESMRAALFIVGSLGLLVGAIMFLKRPTPEGSNLEKSWKEKFKYLSYKQFIIGFCAIMISYGCVIDYILIRCL